MDNKQNREYPRLCLCLVFCWLAFSCSVQKQVDHPKNKTEQRTSTECWVVNVRLRVDKVYLMTSEPIALPAPFDLNSWGDGFRRVLQLTYRFDTLSGALELKEDLLASYPVESFRIIKN